MKKSDLVPIKAWSFKSKGGFGLYNVEIVPGRVHYRVWIDGFNQGAIRERAKKKDAVKVLQEYFRGMDAANDAFRNQLVGKSQLTRVKSWFAYCSGTPYWVTFNSNGTPYWVTFSNRGVYVRGRYIGSMAEGDRGSKTEAIRWIKKFIGEKEH